LGVVVLSRPELLLAVGVALVPGLVVSGLRRLRTFSTV
jgi:hypothetical protein